MSGSKPNLDHLKSVLDGLTKREAEVLKKRFGIDVSSNWSLEDIAREFDITREKIEEIELKALQKLGSIRNKPDDDV